MEPSGAIKQTWNPVAMRVRRDPRGRLVQTAHFIHGETEAQRGRLALPKITICLAAKPGPKAKPLSQLAADTQLSKYRPWQCFRSSTLKMRSRGKVRAKSLSNGLRQEEEMMGFIMAGITLLTFSTVRRIDCMG